MMRGQHKKASETEQKGALATRVRSDGRRSISLTASERKEIANKRMIERIVSMFLDVEQPHSWNEIASEVGISLSKLKDITNSDEFMEVYSQYYASLGHDPRVQAAQAQLADMLPVAVHELRLLLQGSDTPQHVRLKAIQEIIRLNGLTAPRTSESERAELEKFLRNVTVVNVNLPDDLKRAEEFIDVKPVDLSVPLQDLGDE